eukprot:TRINITY_DN853_c0_g1_i10.p2 TRINITY_DN853_c0_g1~~TRINITY_DN853_c0_g1_i10.p2  ORF type:complete len:231 (+),score=57.48 TRINITY_DN853_c0_g1_i10:268-960(+)
MKLSVFLLSAICLYQGVVGSSDEAPKLDVKVSGTPSLSQQHTAAVEILKTQCAKLFPHRLCFPSKILDATTGKDGVETLVSLSFQVCCYNPKMISPSNSFIVKGIYRTNPGYINLGVSDVSATIAHASCPALQPQNILKRGDDVGDAVLRRFDTEESHNSIASGLSRSFSGFESNSKLFLAKFGGKQFDGYSVQLDVRGKLDRAGTKFEDFPLSASVVNNGNRQEVLCMV